MSWSDQLVHNAAAVCCMIVLLVSLPVHAQTGKSFSMALNMHRTDKVQDGDTNSAQSFGNASANSLFGNAIAAAGDVNGDGFPDLLVGANGWFGTTGAAYVYFCGPHTDSTADLSMFGTTPNDNFGGAVAGNGDVNGDGYADFIVGMSGYDSKRGRALVYFGSASPDDVADVDLTGANLSDYFGGAVACNGDLDNDGFDDIVVGAIGPNSVTGAVYVYRGGASILTTPSFTLGGEATFDNFGAAVACFDANGDGIDDLLIGAPRNDAGGSSAGRVYVYFGGASFDTTPDLILTGAGSGYQFGAPISSAGDFNGDGYTDILASALALNNSQGRVFLYYGGPALDNTSDAVFHAPVFQTTHQNFGYSLAAVGDLNGDGFDDIMVGSPFDDVITEPAAAYLYYGSEIPETNPDLTYATHENGDHYGTGVASLGDINGDYYPDIATGASHLDQLGADAGRAFLFLTSVPPTDPVITNLSFSTETTSVQHVMIEWIRGSYDVKAAPLVNKYLIQTQAVDTPDTASWMDVDSVTAIQHTLYGTTIPIPATGLKRFRVVARTASPDTFWLSRVESVYVLLMTTVTVGAEWNIVSVPVIAFDFSVTALFTSASGPALSYSGGSYSPTTTLEYGRGYWLRFPSGDSFTRNGLVAPTESIAVSAGWNLIGSMIEPVPLSSIQSNPGGMVTSRAYIYNGHYLPTDTLQPGKGHWIKVNSDGKLIFAPSFTNVSSQSRIHIVASDELPPSGPPADGDESGGSTKPSEFTLFQSYPNPFNPTTTISFELKEEALVTLNVYNTLGQEVAELIHNELMDEGTQEVKFDGSALSSGVYYYKIVAEDAGGNGTVYSSLKKMLLMK